ncbi:hypothetical protein HZA45_02935 [Candidatus Peregrinibacteria bacterium]|nr:hypothetical protein [Candidatus Peregrinibacteria bacterium]
MKRLTAAAAATVLAATVAMPVFAEGMSASAGANASVKAKKTVDIVCVQTAVDKREQAIAGAWTAFNAGMTTAYATRASALHTAWGMTDAAARRAAVKAAWDAFRTSSKSAMKTHREAKKNAWKTFRTEAKACRGAAAEVSVEASGEAADNQ